MTGLILLGLLGIGVLLVLVLFLKFHPFLALLMVSIGVALLGGVPVSSLAKTIEEGLGGSMGHVALIIALGAMIGRIVEESGGAEVFARALMRRFKSKSAPVALAIAGFFVGIPVFFEVGVIMMMPLAHVIARRTEGRLAFVALPMCITMLIVHALLPPHPGAVAVAGLLSADLGRMLLFGLPIAAFTALVSKIASDFLSRGPIDYSEEVRALLAEGPGESEAVATAPQIGVVIALILTPVLLSLGGTLAGFWLPEKSAARQIFTVLGIPFVALLVDVLFCLYFLGLRRGWSRDRVSHVVGGAIPGIASVVFITGGGAIFAKVLVTTGIGAAVAALLQSTGLPLLLLAFVLTMLVRAVQGPTTVALITVGGILAPFLAQARLDPNHVALICLAMGAGGIAVSHVNDAGFWIVTRLLGLDVRTGLRTWTVLTTIAGVTGFLAVFAVWLIV